MRRLDGNTEANGHPEVGDFVRFPSPCGHEDCGIIGRVIFASDQLFHALLKIDGDEYIAICEHGGAVRIVDPSEVPN